MKDGKNRHRSDRRLLPERMLPPSKICPGGPLLKREGSVCARSTLPTAFQYNYSMINPWRINCGSQADKDSSQRR